MRSQRHVGVVAALLWSLVFGGYAHAQPAVAAAPALAPTRSAAPHAPAAPPSAVAGPKGATPRAEREKRLQEARAKLEAGTPDTIDEAFAALRDAGGAEAAQLVSERLRRGLPPQLVDLAIDALVSLKQPSAAPVLLELTLHRRWQVREKAVAALGVLGVKSAQPALLFALDDPSAEVRSAAVHALRSVGDVRALPAVLVAAERGVDGALETVGSLGGSKEAEALLVRAKAGELARVEKALSVMLLRRNFPPAEKRKIVGELAALGTDEAKSCLSGWLGAALAANDTGLVGTLRAALDAKSPPPAPASGARPQPDAATKPAATPVLLAKTSGGAL